MMKVFCALQAVSLFPYFLEILVKYTCWTGALGGRVILGKVGNRNRSCHGTAAQNRGCRGCLGFADGAVLVRSQRPIGL